MTRLLIVIFSAFSYGLFLVCALALMAFLQNAGPWEHIDGGATGAHPYLVNVALVLLFGVQHSVMARAGFKSWLKRLVSASAERSVYVLLSSAVLLFVMWAWQPLPETVWHVNDKTWQSTIHIIYGCGWLLLIGSTFQINHWELVGIAQALRGLRRLSGQTVSPFVTPFLYRIVRHPMMTGMLVLFWASPHMTVGHALFAGLFTAYILVGTRFEERDLVKLFGDQYRLYQSRVPAIVPFMVRSGASKGARPDRTAKRRGA